MLLPHLTGARIFLRPHRRSDISALEKQANDKTISKFIPSIQYPYTAEHARRWVNRTLRQVRNDSACQVGIELAEKKCIIGIMGIKNLNSVDRNGE